MSWTIPESYRNRIPDYMHEGVERYVNNHTPPGGFLKSVFSNDLVMVYSKADSANRNAVQAYVELMFNQMPSECWGSAENYKNWIGGDKE